MRLIDADSLKELYEGFGEYEDNLVVPIKVVLQSIDEQPAAYNLDSVLYHLQKELKEAEAEEERTAKENPSQFDVARGYEIAISNAIEYVKGGLEKNNG